ncbi:MAG: hypothetical protein ABGZ17_01655 [Planctomycetaceae bacterium]
MSEPYRAPEQELADDMPDLVAKKRRILIWLLAYMGIFGLVSGFQGEVTDPLINVAMGLPLLILFIMWCFADAREHQVCGFGQNSHNRCPVFAIIDVGVV